ncbi:hypothetical protein EDD18DRAFT_1359859 [Armillaria luteobubalina]|uniref:Phospholipid/glycerol acyltransferase domain-containing protein n=1 Tax=Armillaria luteobubalina TaxID=153913 RepID=A0AA39UG98_9AGAR|nr:hypothetical protein EDD18DRAFT_1359859 [Armillaria luteobubalina]
MKIFLRVSPYLLRAPRYLISGHHTVLGRTKEAGSRHVTVVVSYACAVESHHHLRILPSALSTFQSRCQSNRARTITAPASIGIPDHDIRTCPVGVASISMESINSSRGASFTITKMFDLFLLHRIILFLLEKLVFLFFAEVRVIGGENVPHDRPVVVALCHSNIPFIPSLLSTSFPKNKILRYYMPGETNSLPTSSIYRLLLSSGGILTQLEDIYEALATGAAVPIFSDDQKSSMDDAASVALGYHKWLTRRGLIRDPEQTRVNVVPATLVTTDQFNYRSSVIIEFGSPIPTTSEACLSDETMNLEVLRKSIVSAQVEATIHALDQDTLFAMQAARDLLWGRVDAINIDEFVPVSQTLVDLLSSDMPSNIQNTKRILVEYFIMLRLTNLTDSIISSLPVPRSLDPDVPGSPIHRILALLALSTSTILSLIHVPPYCLSLVIRPSSFILTAVGSWLIRKPVPDQLRRRWCCLTLAYLTFFCFLVVSHACSPRTLALTWLLCYYSLRAWRRPIIASSSRIRRLVAAWALLLGRWAPHQVDSRLEIFLQHAIQTFCKLSSTDHRTFAPLDMSQFGGVSFGFERPPMLRLVLFTVQSRARAMVALADFFEELEKLGEGANLGTNAHLDRTFGNDNDRTVGEILKFLRWKGLNIPQSYSLD